MFAMDVWQWVVVAVVAAACVGGIAFAVSRMFARRAQAPALLREATAFESAAVGASAPSGAEAFDGFAYRVPARFAGRARIVVDGQTVSVAGPRVPDGLYMAWIWGQAMLMALVLPALAAALVRLDWRWAVTALLLAAASFAVQGIGAGIWPGLGELRYIEAGRFDAVEFPRAGVSDVKIGEGWADGGIDVVLAPYKGAIDRMAVGRCVSFTAPDENGRSVRYALHCVGDDDATALAALLR